MIVLRTTFWKMIDREKTKPSTYNGVFQGYFSAVSVSIFALPLVILVSLNVLLLMIIDDILFLFPLTNSKVIL